MEERTKNRLHILLILVLIIVMMAVGYTEDHTESALRALEYSGEYLELFPDSTGTYMIIMDGDTTRYKVINRIQPY